MDKIVIVVEKGMVQSVYGTHPYRTDIVCRKWSRYSAKFIERSLRYECE